MIKIMNQIMINIIKMMIMKKKKKKKKKIMLKIIIIIIMIKKMVHLQIKIVIKIIKLKLEIRNNQNFFRSKKNKSNKRKENLEKFNALPFKFNNKLAFIVLKIIKFIKIRKIIRIIIVIKIAIMNKMKTQIIHNKMYYNHKNNNKINKMQTFNKIKRIF